MDLGLPPPPDIAAGRKKARPRSNAGIAALSIGLALVVLCTCAGFAGFMSFAFGQAAEPARREVDPWLRLLVEERYDEAARQCGTGVTGDDLRAAVDRGVGAPLRSYKPEGDVRLTLNLAADTEGYSLTYRMEGSRGSATTTIKWSRKNMEGARKIAVPDWGIDPGFASTRRGAWSGPGATPESTTRERPPEAPKQVPRDQGEPRGKGLRLPSGEPAAEATE